MAKGIAISIAADTRDFAGSVKRGLIDPLAEAAETLNDLGDAGARDVDKLERSLSDAQRETKQLGDTLRDSVHERLKDVGDAGKREFGRASQGAEDFKGEAKQNAQEVAASFDGSVEGIADGFQGLAATAFSGFGPAGLVAGTVAAAGIGLVGAALVANQEAADEAKQHLTDMYKDAIAEGHTFLSEAQINAEVLEQITNPDKLKNAREEAAKLNVDVTTYIRGQSGDQTALNYVLEQGAQAEKDRAAYLSENGQTRANLADDELNSIKRILTENEKIAGQHTANQEAATLYADAVAEGEQRNRDQINRTADVSQERYEGIASTYGVPIKLSAEIDTRDAERKLADLTRIRESRVVLGVYNQYGRPVI